MTKKIRTFMKDSVPVIDQIFNIYFTFLVSFSTCVGAPPLVSTESKQYVGPHKWVLPFRCTIHFNGTFLLLSLKYS